MEQTESLEINPCLYGQFTLDKGGKNIKYGKDSLLDNLCKGPGQLLSWLEHRPDTPRLQVQSPIRAHRRINQ